jgi:ubiquitin-like protein Pup
MTGLPMNNKDDSRSKHEVEAAEVRERHEDLSDAVDAILDEIDEVMNKNAEEFVRSYVQKGGQGWSGFFTPEFYVGAASAGIYGGATYDMFKAVIRRITKYLLQIPGRTSVTLEEYETSEIPEYEASRIEEAWKTASRLAEQQDVQHSMDEATALHWKLFTQELEHSLGSVRLGNRRIARLVRANAASEKPLDVSPLAARIIDQWLEQNELHSRLRKAREEAGLTLQTAAEQLEWSPAKLIRIEVGAVDVRPADLTVLLRLYKVESPQLKSELMGLSKAQRQLRKLHRL